VKEMTHIFENDIFSRYIDGECTQAETRTLESHIAACDGCRVDFTVLRNSVAVLQNTETIELPKDFDSMFNKRLDEAIAKKEQKDAIRHRRVPVFAAAFASVLLAAIISVVSLRMIAPLSPMMVSAEGGVEIFDKGRGQWEKAPAELALRKGDIVRTAEGASAVFEAPSLYTIKVKDASEFEVAGLTRRALKGMAAISLKSGRMFVDIEKKFQGSQFKIFTHTAETKALGTRFMVEAAEEGEKRTWIGVLEGEVEVKSAFEPPRYARAKQTVIVKEGQKTEVHQNAVPGSPQKLLDAEWKILRELYQLSRKAQIALLIGAGENRVQELLKPCAIYISDEESRAIPSALEEIVPMINQAIVEADVEKHLSVIEKLKGIIEDQPEAPYARQLLLFVGSYYYYVDRHKEAIQTFERVARDYPGSSLASLAECAIAVVYEKGLNDTAKAAEVYSRIINQYPSSPEASFAKQHLEAGNK